MIFSNFMWFLVPFIASIYLNCGENQDEDAYYVDFVFHYKFEPSIYFIFTTVSWACIIYSAAIAPVAATAWDWYTHMYVINVEVKTTAIELQKIILRCNTDSICEYTCIAFIQTLMLQSIMVFKI